MGFRDGFELEDEDLEQRRGTYYSVNLIYNDVTSEMCHQGKSPVFPYLEDPHEQLSAIGAVRGVGFEPDAFDQIEQQFAGHGLNGRRQGFVVHVFREEIDGQGEIF